MLGAGVLLLIRRSWPGTQFWKTSPWWYRAYSTVYRKVRIFLHRMWRDDIS